MLREEDAHALEGIKTHLKEGRPDDAMSNLLILLHDKRPEVLDAIEPALIENIVLDYTRVFLDGKMQGHNLEELMTFLNATERPNLIAAIKPEWTASITGYRERMNDWRGHLARLKDQEIK